MSAITRLQAQAHAHTVQLDLSAFETTGHLIVARKQPYRLAETVRAVRVLSGCAWLTVKGRDIIVPQGEMVVLDGADGGAIISSVNKQPVMLELL